MTMTEEGGSPPADPLGTKRWEARRAGILPPEFGPADPTLAVREKDIDPLVLLVDSSARYAHTKLLRV